MSAFSKIASGTVPTRGSVSAKDLFSDYASLTRCRQLVAGTQEGEALASLSGKVKIEKYKVETFDLSDQAQREAYEKLWVELFEMVSNGEAFVDARKDLVHRPDGTSYWLKYVEYATFKMKDAEKDKEGKHA